VAAELTPAQRTLRARIASQTRWSMADPVAGTAPARRAFFERFEKQVDPEGQLSAAERQRRAKLALRAHMSRLALQSSRVRRSRAVRKRPKGRFSDLPWSGDQRSV
jgi:hypothetical protein